jgi:hypothetical protein
MRKVIRLIRTSAIGVALLALAVVLFPHRAEPLWAWATSIASSAGYDSLPPFSALQGFAGTGLLVLTVAGVAYNWWRDRSYRALEAEYSHQTGAKHLRGRVGELEDRLKKMSARCDQSQQRLEALNKAHTAALISSKEHEVRSQYGQEDRAALADLRNKLETLLREKGHIDGIREALAWIGVSCQREGESAPVADLRAAAERPAATPHRNGKAGNPGLPSRS